MDNSKVRRRALVCLCINPSNLSFFDIFYVFYEVLRTVHDCCIFRFEGVTSVSLFVLFRAWVGSQNYDVDILGRIVLAEFSCWDLVDLSFVNAPLIAGVLECSFYRVPGTIPCIGPRTVGRLCGTTISRRLWACEVSVRLSFRVTNVAPAFAAALTVWPFDAGPILLEDYHLVEKLAQVNDRIFLSYVKTYAAGKRSFGI
jgi:hypothetical protein